MGDYTRIRIANPYLLRCNEGSRSLTIDDNGTERDVSICMMQTAWSLSNSPPAITVWRHDRITQNELRLARRSASIGPKKSAESPKLQEWMHGGPKHVAPFYHCVRAAQRNDIEEQLTHDDSP